MKLQIILKKTLIILFVSAMICPSMALAEPTEDTSIAEETKEVATDSGDALGEPEEGEQTVLEKLDVDYSPGDEVNDGTYKGVINDTNDSKYCNNYRRQRFLVLQWIYRQSDNPGQCYPNRVCCI